MRSFVVLSTSLVFLSTAVIADDAKPAIDLSTQSGTFVVEEEYQSIRPGAMDKRFEREEGVGGTSVNLSYDEDQPERDEYGIIREIEGPATTDYSKPPQLQSDN